MPVSSKRVQTAPGVFRVAFLDGPATPASSPFRIACPWLHGSPDEAIFAGAAAGDISPGARLFQSGDLLIGHACEPFVARDLAARTQAIYERILACVGDRHLYRIWNYVPQINALTAGLENYRAFCQGRSVAFEAHWGASFPRRLPAGSAVGAQGEHVDVIFVAGPERPRHVENPEQVPAYEYPAEYGPRAPSFARATVARAGDRTFTFISGTSAIKGHHTIPSHSLGAQLDCTLDNLRLIGAETGLGRDLAANRATRRHFKIYLRRIADLPAVRSRLERDLLRPEDSVIYLHAEICRAALNVEIEATVEQSSAAS